MKLIIELPDELKEKMDNCSEDWMCDYVHAWDSTIARAIKNGTPLPNHGRLIDADALIEWLELYDERYIERFAKTPIKDIPMYYLGKRNRNDDVISIIDRFLIVI